MQKRSTECQLGEDNVNYTHDPQTIAMKLGMVICRIKKVYVNPYIPTQTPEKDLTDHLQSPS